MRLTPSVVFKLVLVAVVIVAAAVVLFLPRTEFFKGAFIQSQQKELKEAPKEPASIVIHYLKDEKEKEVKIGSKNVHVFSADVIIENEPVEITGFALELEGEASLSNLECIVNNKLISNTDFTWLNSNSLLVDLSGNPQKIEKSGKLEVLGTVVNARADSSLRMHLADIKAKGTQTGSSITNIGVNSEAGPSPQTLRFVAP